MICKARLTLTIEMDIIHVKPALHELCIMREEVQNLIRDYRLERGLTQEDLAQAVGVSRQSINAIERFRYIPSLPLALRFAQFFNCSTDELFRLMEDDQNAL